jgi:hypothetical protein
MAQLLARNPFWKLAKLLHATLVDNNQIVTSYCAGLARLKHATVAVVLANRSAQPALGIGQTVARTTLL